MSNELKLAAEDLGSLAASGSTTCSSATSVRQDAAGTSNDGNNIKLRRQAKNKLKKEETKRNREEELRRKLYEPKDQRIRLVKRSELEKILSPPKLLSNTPARTVPIVTDNDFPSLGKSKTSGTTKYNEKQPVSRIGQDFVVGTWSSLNSELEYNESNTPTNSQDAKQIYTATTPGYISFRKPKRNAPIKIQVLSALKKSKSVTQVQGSKQKTKKDIPTQLSGNQLDSSNPTRNKGKKREVPKDKKPTNLKLVILQDRESKRSLGNVSFKPEENAGSNEILSTSNEQSAQVSPCQSTGNVEKEETSEPSTLSSDDKTRGFSKDYLFSEKESGTDIKEDEPNLASSIDPVASAKVKMHSRKFREYCNHSLSAELDSIVSALIKDIVKFQDRLYFNDPIKAHARRRFVLGFRESKKYLELKKIKLLIIAPDLEKVQSAGGIDDTVEELKMMSAAQEVPCVFALGRKVLKKLTNKSFKISGISCMGVLSYEGTQDNFNAIIALLPRLHTQYEERLNQDHQHFKTQPDESAEMLKKEAALDVKQEGADIDVTSEVVASFLLKLSEEIGKK